MQKFIPVILMYLFLCGNSFGQNAAVELLDKSIMFHDPNNNWNDFNAVLNFRTEWPNKEDDRRKVKINNKARSFSFWAQYGSDILEYKVSDDKGSFKWNGTEDAPDEMTEKYKISKDRAIMYRDYYKYLYGMPMKLKDPGTLIDSDVEQVEFYGKKYDRIRVTYDPTVGKDIWYFYFDQSTHALEAYQFYHDEEKNDGEYILFEEIVEIENVKIPRIRKWFYNTDQKFLATDILLRN